MANPIGHEEKLNCLYDSLSKVSSFRHCTLHFFLVQKKKISFSNKIKRRFVDKLLETADYRLETFTMCMSHRPKRERAGSLTHCDWEGDSMRTRRCRSHSERVSQPRSEKRVCSLSHSLSHLHCPHCNVDPVLISQARVLSSLCGFTETQTHM